MFSGTGNHSIVQFHPPTLSWGGLNWVFSALSRWDCEKERRGEKRGSTWPPSDPEMMLSASSDKAQITYCSVWAVAIVSASGMTEGSKENPSIWCSISPYPSTFLCFYLLISLKAFFFFPPPEHTLSVHFSAGLCCVLFCRVCLATYWENIYFSFISKTRSP